MHDAGNFDDLWGWVTRLGAKGPANVAPFRGGTASQRYGSKRSRCATPPKVLKNRMCGINSKHGRGFFTFHTHGAHGPATLYCSSLSSAESSCSSAASKLRPSPCAVTLRLFVGDLAHTTHPGWLAAREARGWMERVGVRKLCFVQVLLPFGGTVARSGGLNCGAFRRIVVDVLTGSSRLPTILPPRAGGVRSCSILSMLWAGWPHGPRGLLSLIRPPPPSLPPVRRCVH